MASSVRSFQSNVVDAGLPSPNKTLDGKMPSSQVVDVSISASAPTGKESIRGASQKLSKLSRARKSFYNRFVKRKSTAPKPDPIPMFPLMTDSGSPWPRAFADITEFSQPVDDDWSAIRSYMTQHPDDSDAVSALIHSLALFLNDHPGGKDLPSYVTFLSSVSQTAGAQAQVLQESDRVGEAAGQVLDQGTAISKEGDDGAQEGLLPQPLSDAPLSPSDLFGSPTSIKLRNSSDRVMEGVVPMEAPSLQSQPSQVEDTPPAMDIIEEFQRNFASFKEEMFMRNTMLMKELSLRQTPKVMVIGCCDSRTSATMVMRAAPGQLFTVRNVANLVPTYERGGSYHGTSAALEYAVKHLKVAHIIVMGHRSCGGIRALMGRDPEVPVTTDFIDKWVEIAWPARQQTLAICGDLPFDKQCRYCEKESINVSLGNLLTFPFIKQAVNANHLFLHGMYYDLAEGTLHRWRLVYKITDYEKWT